MLLAFGLLLVYLASRESPEECPEEAGDTLDGVVAGFDVGREEE